MAAVLILRLSNQAIGQLKIQVEVSLIFPSPNGPIAQSLNPNPLLDLFPDQHHVRIRMSANQSQLLPVKRPVEVENVLGSEIRKLLAFGSIQGLEPEVVDATITNWVNHPFAVA